MKLSEVSVNDVINYLHDDSGVENESLISAIIMAARQFICTYTGQTLEALDKYEDCTIALFVLCAEMFDNRQYTVANDKINPVIYQILGSYRINLC